MREITLGSLFDGIGGFPYAASFYGIRTLWASEIEPSCISVTQKHFSDMAHMGDITQMDGANCPQWTSSPLAALAKGFHWRASAGVWPMSGAAFS